MTLGKDRRRLFVLCGASCADSQIHQRTGGEYSRVSAASATLKKEPIRNRFETWRSWKKLKGHIMVDASGKATSLSPWWRHR